MHQYAVRKQEMTSNQRTYYYRVPQKATGARPRLQKPAISGRIQSREDGDDLKTQSESCQE